MEEHQVDEPGLPAHVPDLSPEARRIRAEHWRGELAEKIDQQFGKGSRLHRVFTRVWTGAWNDGFIHAGNLAYTTIVALFPFFITVTAVYSAIGEPDERIASVSAFLAGLHDKELNLSGDFVEIMWFQGLTEFLQPGK